MILLDIYPPKSCVHSYLNTRSIKTNAAVHLNKKILINLDLSEFFPSINFGRVLGLFKAFPFDFNDEVAITLAQICCFNSTLPQGAPTSPIISNLICRRLDNAFLNLAHKDKFTYSRYADDITISSNKLPLSPLIGLIENNELILSDSIQEIITVNGFKVNNSKIRYAYKNNRQEVTGLVVNGKKVNVSQKYIRHVKAMIHAWDKYGIEKASKEHFEKYNYRFKKPSVNELAFQSEVLGKVGFIGYVRGKDDKIYISFFNRLKKLNPKVRLTVIQKAVDNSTVPIVLGEGKTDWKHIKAALNSFQERGKFTDLSIRLKNIKIIQISELQN